MVLISILYFESQLNAQKTQLAAIDHLKEIERLRGLLNSAEANVKTLTNQLATRDLELQRSHEKVTVQEQSIKNLEEKNAESQTMLHRAQNELKDAQDLVNTNKKHASVLQDTLTVK